MDCTIQGVSYRLIALEGDGQWIARAFRVDDGERFGVDAEAPTEDGALALLRSWLEWHHEHVSALETLQQAERAYHRTVTGAAFATGAQSEEGRPSLDAVDRARAALDAVRARRPSV